MGALDEIARRLGAYEGSLRHRFLYIDKFALRCRRLLLVELDGSLPRRACCHFTACFLEQLASQGCILPNVPHRVSLRRDRCLTPS